MENESKVKVNVTKIVKYVCIASVLIVGIIFAELGYKAYIKSDKE